ncbi:hypothetical protein ACIRON_02985 [Nocardioides sp. NPDC101246]|uniref:hypothetical protein n=1 Tax=Nocardioides sp. NPDC101246 TaxID=3364336 RepID=UPI00380181A3
MSGWGYFWTAAFWFGLAIALTVVLGWFGGRAKRNLPKVVPLNAMLHEQASAEAYDDLPDMDVEAGVVYGPREVLGPLPKREPGEKLDWTDAQVYYHHADREQPGDDTMAALHDMSVEEFWARLREQQIAVSAAVAAQRLDVEIFDLLHDEEGSR